MLAPIYQVDAFTRRRFRGNPAAVVPLMEWPSDDRLQDIAAENNLSETAFYVAEPDPEQADFRLRWFTPLVEVDLCGHATLAAAHVIMRHRGWSSGTVRFDTRSGALTVRSEKGGYLLDLPTRAPEPVDEPDPGLAAALGAEPLEVLSSRDLLCVLGSEREVAELTPDFPALARIDAPAVIVTAAAEQAGVDFVSRFFAPRLGVAEDPVTGSAHCTLVPFWAERLGRTELEARQLSPRGGVITGRLLGDRVLVGGQAVTYLEGSIDLDEA